MSVFCSQPENSGIFLLFTREVFLVLSVLYQCAQHMASGNADELTIRVTEFSFLLSESHISNSTFSRVHSLAFICINTFLYRPFLRHRSFSLALLSSRPFLRHRSFSFGLLSVFFYLQSSQQGHLQRSVDPLNGVRFRFSIFLFPSTYARRLI